jgi:hypothetical protein
MDNADRHPKSIARDSVEIHKRLGKGHDEKRLSSNLLPK